MSVVILHTSSLYFSTKLARFARSPTASFATLNIWGKGSKGRPELTSIPWVFRTTSSRRSNSSIADRSDDSKRCAERKSGLV